MKSKIEKRDWGVEITIASNPDYEFMAYMFKPNQTLEFSVIRPETFHLWHGEATLDLDGQVFPLVEGNTVNVKPGQRYKISSGIKNFTVLFRVGGALVAK